MKSGLKKVDIKNYIKSNQFAKGSMLPKIEACLSFVENSDNKTAIISSLENARMSLKGKMGTRIRK